MVYFSTSAVFILLYNYVRVKEIFREVPMLEEESGVLKHSVSIFVVEVFVVFLNCICQTKSLAVISACVYFKGSVIIGELLGNLAIDITL